MNEEDVEDLEELLEEVKQNRRKDDNKPWGFTPQSVSAIIASLTVVTAFFWNVSDFRVNMTDQGTRITTLSQRITDLERKIGDIDTNGTRNSSTSGIILNNLQKQIDDLKTTTKELNDALSRHNDVMYELVKKRKSELTLPN